MYLGHLKGSMEGLRWKARLFSGRPMLPNLELFDRRHDSLLGQNLGAASVRRVANAEDSRRHETALAIAGPKALARYADVVFHVNSGNSQNFHLTEPVFFTSLANIV